MRRRLFALFLLLILLLGYLAYLNSLPPAVRAYKLARIPSDEQLIAVYHDKNFWQFATYNPKTQKLKVYALYSDKPILPWGKDVKTVKTPLNYSPLTLDLKLLEKAPKETPALLFNGKWYTKENPPEFPSFDEIIKEYENETLRELTAYYAKKELWIGSITLQTGDAIYGSIGPVWTLTVPDLQDEGNSGFVWEVEVVKEKNASLWVVHYPGDVKVSGVGEVLYRQSSIAVSKAYTSLDNAFKWLNRTSYPKQNPVFLQFTVYSMKSKTIQAGVLVLKYYQKGISMKKKLPDGYVLMDGTDIPVNNSS